MLGLPWKRSSVLLSGPDLAGLCISVVYMEAEPRHSPFGLLTCRFDPACHCVS